MLMKTDDLGIPRFTNKDLIDMIYTGHIDKCHVVLCDPSDDIDKFNTLATDNGLAGLNTYIPLDVNKEEFDETLQADWFMPEKYKNMDLYNYVLDKCPNDPAKMARTCEELTEYDRRNMFDLLKYMVYLVDSMRENDIVWGVGRGSSVSSYVLYLIGVHKVDSVQFDLDYHEFMR